jgi:hypothetical protein
MANRVRMQLYIFSYPNVGPLHCAAAVEWHEDGEGTSRAHFLGYFIGYTQLVAGGFYVKCQ